MTDLNVFLKKYVFVSTQLTWLNFLGQNDSINFVLKSWFTGGTEIRPNFLDQNDGKFFLSVHREKKLQYTMYMTKLLIFKYEWITEKVPLSAASMSRYTKKE